MAAKVQCDGCDTLGDPQEYGWAHVDGRIERTQSDAGNSFSYDLCSSCLKTFERGVLVKQWSRLKGVS